jgi:CHAD domain-containing protein
LTYQLKHSESAEDGLRRVVVERIGRAQERLRDELANDPVAAVHGARKDLKKARSAVRLLREPLGRNAYRKANAKLRDAGRRLSEARDAGVKLDTLTSLREQFADELSPVGDSALTDASAVLDGETPTAEALDAAAAESLKELDGGAVGIESWAFDDGGWSLIVAGVDRAYRRGRAALESVRANPSDEAVHDWRKRSKDLWYHQRLLKKAWPGLLEASADEVHELSDLLGDYHDLSVLAEDLSGTDLSLTVDEQAALAELIERRQVQLLAQALDLGERVYAEKPKAYTRRLHAYWRSWR